jgi:WD40 repeat protein
MPRISKVLFLLLTAFMTIGLVGTSFDVAAQDKKDKKDKKDDKKDPKKEEKKEPKKEPFKPDPAQQEFKADEKEKSSWVFAVAFGADGKSVAAAYRNKSVLIWDRAANKSARILKGPELRGLGDFKSLIYANNQVLVGTGKLIKVPEKKKDQDKGKDKDKAKEKDKDRPIREGEIKVWDAKTGKPGKSLLGHALNIEALAISKDGKQLASASEDQTVKIWDLAAGKDIQTIKGHTDTVNSVAFSPDGKQVVTTSADKTVRVWNVADAKEVAEFKVERMVEKEEPKGKGKEKEPKGKEKAPKGKVTKVKELGSMFTCAVFSPDGKQVIAGNLDGLIKIYDVEGKKEAKELKAHDGIWALALSPDGSKFATGGYDQTIKIWETATGKDLRTIKAHLGTVTSLSFSPDNQSLASGSIDGTVKIWNVK